MVAFGMSAILIVDDDRDIGTIVARDLARAGREVRDGDSAEQALELVAELSFDLVISDVHLDSATSGLDLLRAVKQANPGTQVVLMSAYGSLETAVEGVRAGAFDYVAKPFDVRELIATVDRALASAPPAEPLARQPAALPPGLVGRTAAMVAVYKQIALAADAATPVLVAGESGTGKELVARAIHDYARGAAPRPFVAINCGALAESLLESELFGHVKGSFTGAVADRKGLFEQANGGTIFLDEIGETSPALQVKLLRVLQQGELRPVGGTRDVKVSARVVAATNRELEREVAERRFRQDLYYRLSAFVIRVPPLRERREDVPLLVAQFVRNASARARRELRIAPEAVAALGSHSWPGNVRELENTVERLVIAARSGRIGVEDVTRALLPPVPQAQDATGFSDLPTLEALERRYLLHVLEVAEGNRTRAAKVLGIDRRTLYRMAARFGIPLSGEGGADGGAEPEAEEAGPG
jgi:DNA-binding NtrC family response regulator